MRSVKILSLLVLVISLSGCLDSTSNGPEVIIEHSSRSNYYIANHTDSDLNVTYAIAFLNMDSTVAVLANSTTKIFEAGDIGSSPSPSSAFESLVFSELSNNNTSPLLTIQPIVDQNWAVTGEKDATRFELLITNEDID
tara:strand:+ start:4454 stop:4870 length:417 start_codon:yes stop_codon:yes gene_type:complete